MEKIIINGGKSLIGEVSICGAKNSVVGLIPAALLAEEGVCVIENIPDISDVSIMFSILRSLGAKVRMIDESTVEIDSTNIITNVVPYEMSKSLRASYYFIGALLGRFKKARVAMPGGCDFGTRPIDLHIKSFEYLGAEVEIENGMVNASAKELIGSSIYMDVVSVGATINAMLAAVKAKGLTIIEHAAREPHIVDIANFLNAMGADVKGAGTDVIKIRGVEKLHGCSYSVIPDQIEAGTYMAAVVATGGKALIKNVTAKHLESIMAKLVECGATIEENEDDSILISREKPLVKCDVATMPHPGFPTDMQPQFVALLSTASGVSSVSENVWDNRFKYVDQLIRMGAKIRVSGNHATIEGVEQLKGAPVGATDLRAGAALIIAGLCAKGTTEIENIEYIERGYDSIVEKLSAMGADIKRVTYPDGGSGNLAL